MKTTFLKSKGKPGGTLTKKNFHEHSVNFRYVFGKESVIIITFTQILGKNF